MEQNESDHRIMYWSIKCTGQPWVWSKCQASEAIMNIGHIFLVWFICETRQKDIAKMKNTLLGIWTAIICLNFRKGVLFALRICMYTMQISFFNPYHQNHLNFSQSILCTIMKSQISNLSFFSILLGQNFFIQAV